MRPERAAIRAWFAQENPYIEPQAGVYRGRRAAVSASHCGVGVAQVEQAISAAKIQGFQRL